MQEVESPTELLTLKEVSNVLKVSIQTVRKWTRAGTLPFIYVGRQKRVLKCTVTVILEHGLSLPEDIKHEKIPAQEDQTEEREDNWPKLRYMENENKQDQPSERIATGVAEGESDIYARGLAERLKYLDYQSVSEDP